MLDGAKLGSNKRRRNARLNSANRETERDAEWCISASRPPKFWTCGSMAVCRTPALLGAGGFCRAVSRGGGLLFVLVAPQLSRYFSLSLEHDNKKLIYTAQTGLDRCQGRL